MFPLNLGLLGAALAGGIKGAGRGMTKIADDETERLKQERLQEFKMRENEQQSSLRMSEIKQTADIADKSLDKRQDRGLLDYAAKKKIDIGMATDPANVKAATDAELQAQQAKDQYSDKRFPTELNQKKQEFEMKNPLLKEKIQSELDQNKAQIEHWESYDAASGAKAEVETLKLANDQIEQKLEIVSAMPEDSEPEKIAKNKAMMEVNQEMAQLRNDIAKKAGIESPTSTGGAIDANAIIQKVLGSQESESDYGNRPDGTKKGNGYFGKLKMQDGSNDVATELTIGVNLDGKETNIPALVPSLSSEQKEYLLKGGDPRKREDIIKAAVEHAKDRIKNGLSPYADSESKPRGMVPTTSLNDRINKWTLENDPREFIGNKIDEYKKEQALKEKNKSRYTGH